MKTILPILVLWTLFFVGCTKKQAPQLDSVGEQSDSSSARKLLPLVESLNAIDSRLRELEREEATVTTEEEVYSVAKTRFGAFPVISKGAVTYLDGYKVKLMIGNLTSATFHGAKVTVTWALPLERDISDWIKSKKTKVFDLTTTFLPGKYATVELALTPAKPEEIKKVFVGLEFSRLSLTQ